MEELKSDKLKIIDYPESRRLAKLVEEIYPENFYRKLLEDQSISPFGGEKISVRHFFITLGEILYENNS